MRSQLWLENMRISLTTTAPANTFTLPQTLTVDCANHMYAALLAVCDFFTGGGTITLTLQTAVVDSLTSTSWVDLASTTITAATSKTIWVGMTSSTPLLGKLRVQAVCTGAASDFSLRLELLQKAQVESTVQEWLPSVYLNFAGAGTQTMPADQWVDIARFLNVAALLEWNGASGGNLTVHLQTAPLTSSDETSWLDIGTLVLSSNSGTIVGNIASTVPPMGALRLQYVATGACSGTLKSTFIAKET